MNILGQEISLSRFFGGIEDNIAAENAKIVIMYTNAKGQGRQIQGLTSSEFSINGGNEFMSPMEDSSLIAKASNVVNIGRTVLGAAGENAGGQIASLSKSQTALFYRGSAKPSFNIPLFFYATNGSKAGYKLTSYVKGLYETVYPTFSKGSGDEVLEAPLGYTPFKSTGGFSGLSGIKPKGTISVKIGKWFYATNLIAKDVSFEFSKEVVECGKPLYAVGSITLEPYRVISFEEFSKYFV